jgi:MYXO-CTERM domain-containing protein
LTPEYPTAYLPAGWHLNGGYLLGPDANLTDADLHGLNLNGVNVQHANLHNVSSGGVTGTPTLPEHWQITDGYLIGPAANLSGAALDHVNLDHIHLAAANLSGAHLLQAHLVGADLAGATLDSANMIAANLTGATLTGATLHGTNLTGATLSHANLQYAKLHGALGLPSGSSSQLTLSDTEEIIVGADITGADFSFVELTGVDFNHENDLLDVIGWASATWTGAWFHYLGEPDWPDGMVHTDHGITVRTPEPSTILLALLGLALLPRRRRR